VPETGRSQFNILSPGEEMQLGLTSFEQLKKEVPISKDAALTALVQRVGKRIAAVAPLPDAQWEFVVFESKEANAFCLPGGKVGVYTGILPITRDEAGLATVIGHEVAHAVARHGGERMSQEMLRQGLGTAVGAAVSSADPRLQAATAVVYGLGSELGVMLPYSRAQETEADKLGLIYMARAGYEPAAAVGFWQRFAQYKEGADSTPLIFRTHPTDDQRIRRIQEWLPEVQKEYRPAPGG
jgi:predicted Zn-dependent protease